MGCFTEPLTAKLDGRGDWTKWDGRLTADLGARPLARVAFAARDGTFTAKGTTQASRLFEGSTASLLGAQTDLDLTARLAERKADLDGRVSSDAFRLGRSEEHTSELQSLMRISYAVFWLKKNTQLT